MTTCIIQARMGSTRLPGKILMKLAGREILWHIVERVKRAKTVDKIVVATTVNPEDNEVEKFCQDNNLLYYRGSAENVLERYYLAAEKFGGDIIVRATGDCPLVNPQIIDLCVQAFIKNGCDYISDVSPSDEPKGRLQEVEVLSIKALKKAYENAQESYELEHVTPYIWENKKGEFKIGPIVPIDEKYNRDYRVVVDYPEDFKLMEKIYEKFYKPSEIIDVAEVFFHLDKNPDWSAINANCKQKTLK